MPDEIYNTYAIQDPHWARELNYIEERGASNRVREYRCTQGHVLVFTPDTPEVRSLANRAINYMLCPTSTEFAGDDTMESIRSTRHGSTYGDGIGFFVHEVLQCARRYSDAKTGRGGQWPRWMDDNYDDVCQNRNCLAENPHASDVGDSPAGERCRRLKGELVRFEPTAAEALSYAMLHPGDVLGIVDVASMGTDAAYTIRVNHTTVADTSLSFVSNYMVNEPPAWTTSLYYTFGNIQTAMDAALIEQRSASQTVAVPTGAEAAPAATVALGIKHSPWLGFVSNPFGQVGTLVALILSQCFVATCIVIQVRPGPLSRRRWTRPPRARAPCTPPSAAASARSGGREHRIVGNPLLLAALTPAGRPALRVTPARSTRSCRRRSCASRRA